MCVTFDSFHKLVEQSVTISFYLGEDLRLKAGEGN